MTHPTPSPATPQPRRPAGWGPHDWLSLVTLLVQMVALAVAALHL